MFEIRVHGRGGQGAVTAAELLSVAAFRDGYEAQAFPSFGSERMGAPVVSFCRISSQPIRVREPVSEPDAVVILDPTLLHSVDVFAGLRPDAYVVINASRSPAELGLAELVERHRAGHVVTVPATEIARTHIGVRQVNVCLLGAFAALTGWISLDALDEAVRERFNATVAERNLKAVHAAVDSVGTGSHV